MEPAKQQPHHKSDLSCSPKILSRFSFAVHAIVLLFCVHCTPKNNLPQSIEQCLVDSLYLPLEERGFSETITGFMSNGVPYAGYVNKDMKVFIYNLETNRLADSTTLPYAANTVCKVFLSKDSTLTLLEDVNTLILNTSRGNKTWDLTNIIKQIDTFGFASDYGNPLFVRDGNKVILELYTNRTDSPVYGLNASYKKYAYWVIAQLGPDSVTILSKYNPHLQHPYRYDYDQRFSYLLTNNLDIIYSANHCDTLFKKSPGTGELQRIKLTSPYFKENTPVNPDSSLNFKYSNNYDLTQSRFGIMLYDHTSNSSYIFMKHACKPVEENGDVNEYYDCPLSIFMISEDFTKQKEFYIPPNLVNNCYMGFCINNYLYIPADGDKQTVKGKTLYYKFRLHF